jgi:hypothetical protein
MAVRIVDLLEIIDVEDDRREAPVRLGGAGAGFARLLEEAAPITEPRQRIDGRKPDQLTLHRGETLGSAEPRVELFGEWRLANEIIGARVQCLDQAALIVLTGHHDHVDRTAAGGEKPRLPAKLYARHIFKLGAGDQSLNAGIGRDLSECFALVGEGHDLMTTRFEHAGDDQSSRAARIDQGDAH